MVDTSLPLHNWVKEDGDDTLRELWSKSGVIIDIGGHFLTAAQGKVILLGMLGSKSQARILTLDAENGEVLWQGEPGKTAQ